MVELPDTVYLRYEDQEVKCGLCSLEISTDTPSSRCGTMTGSAPSPRGWGASPWSAWRRAAAPSPASASSPGAATSPRSRARAAGSYISIYDSCLFMYLLIMLQVLPRPGPGQRVSAVRGGDHRGHVGRHSQVTTVRYSALRYRGAHNKASARVSAGCVRLPPVRCRVCSPQSIVSTSGSSHRQNNSSSPQPAPSS